MFDQLKQLKQLKEMQDQLKKERVEAEKNGVRIIMNGKMEIEEIFLNPDLGVNQQEKAVKDCANDAVRKVQMSLAQKMSQMGNFGL
ncbi:MAG: YbaB/EbfC family nucleoid-associated protein [Candidatus Paceibacterota bacterium]|jgi:DNA-binding protein YbaB|nr:YbaB/EbfC family nucleoid-associated protein [Candidatus Paceibacterota bacterium]MDD4830864.1 YbaB/EbfC family nucleoid-associated protein [Candidatus Paceibacterota bacterium]